MKQTESNGEGKPVSEKRVSKGAVVVCTAISRSSVLLTQSFPARQASNTRHHTRRNPHDTTDPVNSLQVRAQHHRIKDALGATHVDGVAGFGSGGDPSPRQVGHGIGNHIYGWVGSKDEESKRKRGGKSKELCRMRRNVAPRQRPLDSSSSWRRPVFCFSELRMFSRAKSSIVRLDFHFCLTDFRQK